MLNEDDDFFVEINLGASDIIVGDYVVIEGIADVVEENSFSGKSANQIKIYQVNIG